MDSMFLIMDFVQHLLIQFLSERKNLINVGVTNPVTGEMMSYSNKCVGGAVRRVCVWWGGRGLTLSQTPGCGCQTQRPSVRAKLSRGKVQHAWGAAGLGPHSVMAFISSRSLRRAR